MNAPTLTRKQRKRLRRKLRRRLTDWKYHQDPCAYCQGTSTTIDHIHARTFRGPDAPINRTGACVRCNRVKDDTPALLFLLRHGGYPIRYPHTDNAAGGARMSGHTSDDIAAVVSDLANALQVALPLAARLHERAEAQAQDAERLETALTRATDAVRRLQPPEMP